MQAYANVNYNDIAICNRSTDFSFFVYFSGIMEEMESDISVSTWWTWTPYYIGTKWACYRMSFNECEFWPEQVARKSEQLGSALVPVPLSPP
jgi:hypothetical protein